jgi:hypothetical protein
MLAVRNNPSERVTRTTQSVRAKSSQRSSKRVSSELWLTVVSIDEEGSYIGMFLVALFQLPMPAERKTITRLQTGEVPTITILY